MAFRARAGRPSIGGKLLAAAAVTFGLGALAVLRKQRRAERRHPPVGRFLTVDGVRLHFIERGSGPPVVLLHGNGAMVEDFLISGLFDALAVNHRVIAFDRPGFGYSARPRGLRWTPREQAMVLDRALALMGVERAVVIGHSWGTLVALAMAMDRPERVRALILLSGYYFPTARVVTALGAPAALPVFGAVAGSAVLPLIGRGLASRMIEKIFAPKPVPGRFARHFPLDLALRPGQVRAMVEDTVLMDPGAAALKPRYSWLRLPVTIIAGAEDQIVDAGRHSVRLHREIPGSRLMVMPGAGHMIHYAAGPIAEAAGRVRAMEKRALGGRATAPDGGRHMGGLQIVFDPERFRS
jgi:pimeloyl-ACP methyl ester carboxylesterase